MTSTGEGTVLGTAAYMSPEQAEAEEGGPSFGPIFSFGSVLYEMLTGQRAFQADTRASTIASILREEPKPISQVSEGLPRDAEKIVRRCLRKDPEHRFQTMADLRVALEELKEESDSGVLSGDTGPQPVRRKRKRLLAHMSNEPVPEDGVASRPATSWPRRPCSPAHACRPNSVPPCVLSPVLTSKPPSS